MSDTLAQTMAWSKIVQEASSKIQLSLIENPHVSEKYFNIVSKILKPQDFISIVQERGISGHCGIPMCKNHNMDGKKFIFDKTTGRMMHIEETLIDCFCSLDCYRKYQKISVTFDDTPPYARNIRDLVQMALPDLNIDLIFKKSGDSKENPVMMIVKEKSIKMTVEAPVKKGIDSIEGYKSRPEIFTKSRSDEIENLEDYEDPFEPDEVEERETFKLSTYQLVWTQISRWMTSDVSNYFKTGIYPDVHDTSFQIFNESILKRIELADEQFSRIIPLLCQKFKFSRVDHILFRIKEAVSLLNCDRQMESLDVAQWNLVGLVFLKCLSLTDDVLSKELECLDSEQILKYGVSLEQFQILQESLL